MTVSLGFVDTPTLPALASTLGRPVATAADVAELGRMYSRPQVWIMPAAHGALGLPDRLPPVPASELARRGFPHPFAVGTYPAGLYHFLTVTEGGPRVDVVLPGYDGASGLGDAGSAAELRAALELLEGALGVPYRWSPGAVSGALLRHVHRRGAHLEPSTLEPPPPALDASVEADLRWIRALDLLEVRRPWCHAFDANLFYLPAASSAELGLGDPEHLIPLRGPLRVDANAPGYWRASTKAPAAHLPDPFDPLGRRGERWMATPTAALAAELGALGPVSEGWVWPRRSRYLAPWYNTLRDARTSLVRTPGPAAALALRVVKRVVHLGIGDLAGHYRSPGDDLHRPDWRHAVIARARANLFRRLVKLEPGAGVFGVNVDCLYVASDHQDPAAAAAAIGLPLGPELGAFKSAGTVPLELARTAATIAELGEVIRRGRSG